MFLKRFQLSDFLFYLFTFLLASYYHLSSVFKKSCFRNKQKITFRNSIQLFFPDKNAELILNRPLKIYKKSDEFKKMHNHFAILWRLFDKGIKFNPAVAPLKKSSFTPVQRLLEPDIYCTNMSQEQNVDGEASSHLPYV